jgi:hypothetical protein
MATITKRPTTGTIAVETFLHLTANGVTTNDGSGDEVRHYMTIETSGQDTLRSQEFCGDWTWDNVILPAAATWTAHLRQSSDDTSVANLAIVAAAIS